MPLDLTIINILLIGAFILGALYFWAGVILALLVDNWTFGRVSRWIGDSNGRGALLLALWPVFLGVAARPNRSHQGVERSGTGWRT